MSLDEHLRAVERAARDGSLAGAERETAARLLGVDGARFWLVAQEAARDEPPHRTSDAAVRVRLPDRACALFARVTEVWTHAWPRGDHEPNELREPRAEGRRWRARWALPVLALEEALDWATAFGPFGTRCRIWDRKQGFYLMWIGGGILGSRPEQREPDRVEDGWRAPRDGAWFGGSAVPDADPPAWPCNRFTPHGPHGACPGVVEIPVPSTGGGGDLAIPSSPVAELYPYALSIGFCPLGTVHAAHVWPTASGRWESCPGLGPQP